MVRYASAFRPDPAQAHSSGSTIRKHLESEAQLRRQAPPGDDLHFCEAKSFIMPNGLVALDAPEFFRVIKHVTNACLHFHFFESRLRLGRPTNDFSQWLQGLGETRLACAIDKLNPYAMTLEELRQAIVELGRKYRVR